jgi:hypothetical protein
VAYRPADRQRPRNKQRVQSLLCNRRINKSRFWATARFRWKQRRTQQ